MKITALVENQDRGGLCGEHGLAVWINCQGKNYLLDTGASGLFSENAQRLGIDLSTARMAVLSHGHYDHSGGYEAFFACNKTAKVYIQETAKERCYRFGEREARYIGIPEGLLETYPDRFVFVKEKTMIDPGVWLVPHTLPNLEERGKKTHMYREGEYGLLPDDFRHEQSLVLEHNEELVILNSCCHAGVENIIQEVRENFGGRKVLAVFGGFHLKGSEGIHSMNLTEEEVKELGRKLDESGVPYIYTGHCTGLPAYEILKEILGEKLRYFATGTTVEL
ncbi:MAG: MBL fold metallo-hydrolase [Clostridiales bacterium]|nr:MBL fold metallo-hydrolase [Clostridiales bacterium]